MLEVLKEGSTLYKWEVGETANHMGYVKNTKGNVFFQNFEPCLSMATFHKLCPTKKMWGIKLSFRSLKKNPDLGKNSALSDFQSQTLIVKTQ
jgi:hypothetical protein